jgi:hypothetical protein
MQSIRCRRFGLALVTCAMALLWGSATSQAATKGECVLHSLPSFVAQGLSTYAASVADIAEVACFEEAGQLVTLEDPELYVHCANQLNWAQPVPYAKTSGPSFNVTLDTFGNATVVLWSSGCSAGETHLRAILGVAPNTTSEESFTVFPPVETPPGIYVLPSHQVEGSRGTFATIVESEFGARGARQRAEVSASNPFHRCKTTPHLRWIFQGKEKAGIKAVKLTLDNDGNGFAVILGGPSCTAGESLILSELIGPPYTQYVTSFVAVPPREVL